MSNIYTLLHELACNRAIARDVTTTPLRHFGAQPDFAVYGRDGELCCC